MSETEPAEPRPESPWQRLRRQVPEIGLEFFSVVTGVLLALWTNDWWNDREKANAASKAQGIVLEEMRDNRAELLSSLEENRQNLEALRAALAADPDQAADGLEVNYSLSLLTTAAWEAATMTGTVGDLEFDWVIKVAKVYELQEQFENRQNDLVDYMAGIDEGDREPRAIMKPMEARFEALLSFNEGLREAYTDVLEPQPVD